MAFRSPTALSSGIPPLNVHRIMKAAIDCMTGSAQSHTFPKFISTLFFQRVETAGEPYPVHHKNRIDLCLRHPRIVLNFDHIMINPEGAAFRTVVNRHHFKAQIMKLDDDIVNPAGRTGGHEHGPAHLFALQTLPGQHIKAGPVGVGNLDVLRQHLQAVQGGGPRRGDRRDG